MLNRLFIKILTFFRIITQAQEITQPKQERRKQEESLVQAPGPLVPLFELLNTLFAVEGLGLTKQNSFIYKYANLGNYCDEPNIKMIYGVRLSDLNIRHILAYELAQGNIAKEALDNEALAKLMGYKTGRSVVQQVARLAKLIKS